MRFVQDKEKYKKDIWQLWKASFQEEEQYLQYYFEWRYPDTVMYMYVSDMDVLISMIHVNPLRMRMQGKIVRIPYIVGVATRLEYQRQGFMAGLMQKVLLEYKNQSCPFLLLKTEHEEYYQSFGFQTAHQQCYYAIPIVQKVGLLTNDKAMNHKVQQGNTEYTIQPLQETERTALAEWAQNYLAKEYTIYVEHDASYFQRIQKEYQSQKGDILLIKKTGQICGYLVYGWQEKEIVIQELICEEKNDTVFPILEQYMQSQIGITLGKPNQQKMPVTMVYIDEKKAVHNSNYQEAPRLCDFSKMLLSDWV